MVWGSIMTSSLADAVRLDRRQASFHEWIRAGRGSRRTRTFLPLKPVSQNQRQSEISSAGNEWLDTWAISAQVSAIRPDLGLEREFRKLADKWYEETEDISVLGDRFMRATYQSIIGLGPDAIPLLLRELQNEPDYWFWALAAITRQNPVPPGADFDQAVEAWLTWGREREML